MDTILHITQRQQWEEAKRDRVYRGDTLASEGFIHCSTPKQAIVVANRLFCGQQGLIILCIDTDRVQTEIRYEGIEGELFPHIYGPLNVDAVFQAVKLEPGTDGKFELPAELTQLFD
jgi:uncharacterized protein (DUF952 family)